MDGKTDKSQRATRIYKVRDWVLCLLLKLRPETVIESSWEEELKVAVFVWKRIADLFYQRFEDEGMQMLLGSTICDLPENIFKKLFEIAPFFILAKGAGFCQAFHGSQETIQAVIFCALDLKPMSWLERRGCMIHEIAHVIRGDLLRPFSLDDPYRHEIGRATDDLAIQWGFEKEIKAVRKYLLERRTNDGTITNAAKFRKLNLKSSGPKAKESR